MRQQHLADARTVTGQELQHSLRNARFVQQLHRFEGHKRRLLGGLRHDGIASSKCGRNLA